MARAGTVNRATEIGQNDMSKLIIQSDSSPVDRPVPVKENGDPLPSSTAVAVTLLWRWAKQQDPTGFPPK